MPKRIVTRTTLPKILRELDRWEGKLTWPLFCSRVAQVIGEPSISKHTLYQYPTVIERFQQRQKELREVRESAPRDYTLELALKRVAELEAQVRRLQETNTLLLDQFRRWQYNAYAQGARVDSLDWDRPLPKMKRK